MFSERNREFKFDDLPVEIKLFVFAFFDAKELNRTAAKICKEWRRLCTDPCLWRKQHFEKRIRRKRSEKIIRALNRNHFVRVVTFCDVHDFSWINQIIQHNSIRDLCFISCSISKTNMALFVTLFPRLEVFSIDDCDNDEVDNGILLEIVNWNLLSSVTLCDMSRENINKYIPVIVERVKCLRELDIELCEQINDRILQQVAELQGRNLKCFSACVSNISSKSYQRLFLRCTNLTTLNLQSPNQMTDNDLLMLQNLKVLRVNSTAALFSENFSKLFSNVKFTRLTKLTISWCYNIDDARFATFMKCCPNLIALEIIGLEKITDEGLKILPLSCRNLKYLMIRQNTKITKRGLEDVVLHLAKMCDCTIFECPLICKKQYSILRVDKQTGAITYQVDM